MVVSHPRFSPDVNPSEQNSTLSRNKKFDVFVGRFSFYNSRFNTDKNIENTNPRYIIVLIIKNVFYKKA